MEDVAWLCGSDAGAVEGAISLEVVRAADTLWATLGGAEAGACAAAEFPRDAAAVALAGGVVVVRCGG